MTARRVERLTAIQADLESRYGVRVIVAALDLTDVKASDAFIASLPEDLRDNVDILVNNAGSGITPGTIYDVDMDSLTGMIDTNIKGVVKMIKLFVPSMLKRQSGHIINISSIVGKESAPVFGHYAATKFYVEAMNTALRAELVATPLRVSLVSPGMTESEFISAALGGDEVKAATFYEGVKVLKAEDIADAIVYTASRPPHVQIVDVIVVPTTQASVYVVHRETPKTA